MAYNKEKIFKQALSAVKEQKLLFIEEIVLYLPCNRATFYRLFPLGSKEYQIISEELSRNKTFVKVAILNNWAKSNNPTLQLAHYRLICTDEERKKLNTTYREVKGDNNQVSPEKISINII